MDQDWLQGLLMEYLLPVKQLLYIVMNRFPGLYRFTGHYNLRTVDYSSVDCLTRVFGDGGVFLYHIITLHIEHLLF